MFRAANNEIVATFAKIQPFLNELRASGGNANVCRHMESVVMAVPGAAELLELRRNQLRAGAKAREAAERQTAS